MFFFKKKEVNHAIPTYPNVKRLDYKITQDALPNKTLKRLPRRVREEVSQLSELIQASPAQAIPPLLKLTKKYSHVPLFYNYLSVAYEKTGQAEKAYASIEESYKRHPDYLFARTNYAFVCLQNQQPEKIPGIFDHKFDLKYLYPDREVFHISEFTSFMGVMALYHHAIGNRKIAKLYYKLLKNIDPEHLMTRRIQMELYPSLFQQLVKRLTRSTPPRREIETVELNAEDMK